jgi:hypothetical protein
VSMSDLMVLHELAVWPANKGFVAAKGREDAVIVWGKTPAEAVYNWTKEQVITEIQSLNPSSPVLDMEIAHFRATGHVPERWSGD